MLYHPGVMSALLFLIPLGKGTKAIANELIIQYDRSDLPIKCLSATFLKVNFHDTDYFI